MSIRPGTGCGAAVVLLALSSAMGAPLRQHVDVQVLGWQTQHAGTTTLWAAIVLKPESGWHTYWKNPGDAGLPTEVHWQLPAGWSAGPIQWPAPERIVMGPLASYGYDTAATLFVPLTPAPSWDHKSPITITSKVNWLACREQCIPETTEAKLHFPARLSSNALEALGTALAALPDTHPATSAVARLAEGRLIVTLEPAQPGQFFPDKEELVEPGDTPRVEVLGSSVRWSARAGNGVRDGDSHEAVTGVWVPEKGRAVVVSAPLLAQPS